MSTYVSNKGVREGPYDDHHIEKLLQEGGLTPDDFGWRPGMKEWQRLAMLYPGVRTPAQPPPLPASVSSTQGSQDDFRHTAVAFIPLAVAAFAAMEAQPVVSFFFGLGGGAVIWHRFFPTASIMLKVIAGALAGVVGLVWGVAMESPDSSELSVPSTSAGSKAAVKYVQLLAAKREEEARKMLVPRTAPQDLLDLSSRDIAKLMAGTASAKDFKVEEGDRKIEPTAASKANGISAMEFYQVTFIYEPERTAKSADSDEVADEDEGELGWQDAYCLVEVVKFRGQWYVMSCRCE